MRRLALAFAAMLGLSGAPAAAQEPVRLYAAGSLRAALTDIAAAFTAETGIAVAGTYGASGLLRERIEKGEPAEIFASANMEHPQMLSRSGRLGPVSLFTRNEMCALVNPATPVAADALLARMLDPAVRLGTSTPKADPSGDYAWEVFRRADAIRPGSFERLAAKAMQLTGGPQSPPPPPGRNVYGMLVDQGQADIFLTYCTNAVLARQETPSLRQVALPAALQVGADYGLGVAVNARTEARRFADFVLSAKGQAILTAQGFAPIR
jgi:ABC-type molybdate transport system substrate-binding protein